LTDNILKYRTQETIGAIVILTLCLILGVNFYTAVGFSLLFYVSTRFFNNIGKTIDIRDLVVLIPSVQWILGAWLSYSFSTDNVFYYMSVDEKTYMSYVVPAVFVFMIAIYINIGKKVNLNDVLQKIELQQQKNINTDLIFIIVGIIANIVIPYSPSSLMFFVFLTGNLQYVGVFLLLYNKERKNKKKIFTGVILIMAFLALSRGMFQLLLLWFVFLFIITSFLKTTTNRKKVLIAISMLVLAFLIQSVKSEYRQLTWAEENTEKSKTSIFSDLVSQRFSRTDLLTSEENINNIIGRINQGWIISRVMSHVPLYESFARGETIMDGIKATLLPRFIYANKTKAGGRKNFERFTGRKLVGATSMNLSVLGEAYANFGKVGGIVFMFFFGLFLNLVYTYINSIFKKIPIMLFFIPLIFLQVVKAENDFAIILNHLVKSVIFVFIVLWGMKVFLNKRLY